MPRIEELANGSILVSADALEKSALLELAKGRCLPKIARGTKQNFHAPQGRLQSDYIGLLGEYAAAAYLRCLFDDTIHTGGDGGIDLKVGDKTVQVKTSFYRNGRIIYNLNALLVADYTVLAYCDNSSGIVELSGWINKTDLIKHRTKMNLGHGMRYVIERKYLYPMTVLHVPHVYENPADQLRYQKVE
jgi:hypothetical protein